MGRLAIAAVDCVLHAGLAFGLILLLPLKLNKKLCQAFFARFLLPVGLNLIGSRTWRVRRQVVSQLNDLVSHDANLRKEGAISVLEVGAGSGPNLEYIKRKVKYWNLDPNPQFDDGFRKNLEKNPNVEMERWIHGYGEDMRGVPDDHFDVVLITYLLCSVTDGEKVIAEFKRVLCKGGRLVFMEHVAHPEGSWRYVLQRLLDPLWSVAFCGCHPTRNGGCLLKNAGFDHLELTEDFLSRIIMMSPHAYGFAIVNKD